MLKPLYMYAGGKSKMIPKYLENPGLPQEFSTYVEPFFGAGAMFCHVANNTPANCKSLVINDVKFEIVSLYKAIQGHAADFMGRMDDLSLRYLPLAKEDRKKFYYDLRDEYTSNKTQWNTPHEAATLYFLMKTAFNGIWQETKNSNGRFATPCGLLNQKDSVYDPELVMLWNEVLQKTKILHGDWLDACKYTDAFYFLDPPYRNSFTQYGESFTDSDQMDLIEWCKEAAHENVVFYCNRDDAEDDFFERQRGTLHLNHYDITYTAGRRKKTEDGYEAKKSREILLHNHERFTLDAFCGIMDKMENEYANS